MVEKLIVFVEEYSMEAALELLLPQLADGIERQIIRFQCKSDLLKQLSARLRGYRLSMPPNWAILVLIDRDDDDCVTLKQTLESDALDAGLITKSQAREGQRFQVINRIVVEELEAWFFGDWAAVKAAYPRVSATIPQKAAYRNPDAIAGGTWEALERVLQRAGYFSTGLRKADCARTIAAHMNVGLNSSASFNQFRAAVQGIVAGAGA